MKYYACPHCHSIQAVLPVRDDTITCTGCERAFVPEAGAEVPAPEPPPRFAVTAFRPTRAGSLLGVGTAVAAGMIGALVLGFACYAIRQYVWLIFIFPIIQGMVSGLVTGLAAKFSRARYPAAVAIVGAACGLVSYARVHYLGYAEVAAERDIGPLGFWEYMDLRATAGVQLVRTSNGVGGTNLGYAGSVIYWCFEAVTVGLCAGSMASHLVRAPFCENCGRWKASREYGPYLTDPDIALPELAAGCPAGMAAPMTVPGSVKLTVYTCPACATGTIDVFASGWRKKGKKGESTSARLTYPPEALAEFERFDQSCRPPD